MNRSFQALLDELVRALPFPEPRPGDGQGLVGYGGDLSPERLLSAYAQGVFPWYNEDPILWFSPDPRFVLVPGDIHVGRNLRRLARRVPYGITMDTAFEAVIEGCRTADRPDQDGTWITEDMRRAYIGLHRLGFAHSVEAWEGDVLVGGLYGVSLGSAFFGESMFATRPDASKLAFVRLARQLDAWGFTLIDCQVHTGHLERFGAVHIPRAGFLERLRVALRAPTRRGVWQFESPANSRV